MHRFSARFFVAILLALPLPALAQGTAATPPPAAATPAPRQPSAAQAAQQERMTACNAEAGTRKLANDARRSFMADCLSGRDMPAVPSAAGGPRG